MNNPCILCGSMSRRKILEGRDILHQTTDNVFSISKCASCSLVFLDPQPSSRELKSFYPKEYRPHRESVNQTLHHTQPLHPTKRVLDVGCGNGDFLKRLAQVERDAEYYGIDINPEAISRARDLGFNISQGTLENSSYPNNYFDTIYLSHVLEHVPNPLTTLKVAYRIQKPGGAIVLKLPNFQSLSRMIFGMYWYGLDIPRHLYQFTPKTVTRLLKNVGYSNIFVRFLSSPKAFLFSISYLMYGVRGKYPKWIWRFLSLPAHLMALIHLSSVMEIKAKKRA